MKLNHSHSEFQVERVQTGNGMSASRDVFLVGERTSSEINAQKKRQAEQSGRVVDLTSNTYSQETNISGGTIRSESAVELDILHRQQKRLRTDEQHRAASLEAQDLLKSLNPQELDYVTANKNSSVLRWQAEADQTGKKSESINDWIGLFGKDGVKTIIQNCMVTLPQPTGDSCHGCKVKFEGNHFARRRKPAYEWDDPEEKAWEACVDCGHKFCNYTKGGSDYCTFTEGNFCDRCGDFSCHDCGYIYDNGTGLVCDDCIDE